MTLQLHDEVNPTPSAEAFNPLGGFAIAPVAPSVGQPDMADYKAMTGHDTEHPGPSPAVIQELYTANLRRAAASSADSSESTAPDHQTAEAPATRAAREQPTTSCWS